MPDAVRDPASYTDPNGYVYWQGDQVRRAIYPARRDFVRRVLAAPTVRALMAEGKLVATRVEADDDDGLVLGHDVVWPRSYPAEWSPGMLRAAAGVVLDVASRLDADGLALADGHPWNVLFAGPKPVFVDVGSIDERSTTLLWPAQVQFDRFFRYPLHLQAAGMTELARGRLADLALGVSPELAYRSLPAGYLLRRPIAAAKLLANRASVLMTSRIEDQAREPGPAAPPRAIDPAMLTRLRGGYFGGLQREIDEIDLDARSAWARYYATCPSMTPDDEAEKQRRLEAILAGLRPRTVVDLGTNTGRYAIMAARAGAEVVAVDQDAASVDALWNVVSREHLRVLPLVMDLGNPTPASGWCAAQRPDAPSRIRSELALMLAVIHHLVFTGNASLEQVAQLADRVASRWAVIEWVDAEDPMSRYLRRTATKDFGFYTLEAFTAALTAVGFDVEAQAPHAPCRQLLVCTRRA